jgi:hypothetical protein
MCCQLLLALLLFKFSSTSISADVPTMWGDVVFYYQTTPYSQSAGVLHDTWPIESLPFPSPTHYIPSKVIVKNAPKLYSQNNINITPWPIIDAADMAARCPFKILKLEHMFPHVCS